MTGQNTQVIDAYAHVGLPRFQSVADYRGVMSRSGIDAAVLCSFDSSPDLAGIHAAFSQRPEVFRGLGVPLGNDRMEIEAAARALLAAGFSGLRLSDADVIERPWLLDILAEERRIAIVCGQASSPECAAILVGSLERNPNAIIIGGHFAGPTDPKTLQDGPVAHLFAHPRFSVVFSRQGGFQPATIRAWAEAVVARTGWKRVMWGSEAPVLFWRNETIADAVGWIDQLAPSPEERADFYVENTRRLYFSQPVELAPLRMPFEPWERARSFPATVWANGLPIEQSVAGRLVHAWLASGGQGTLGNYAEAVLDRALPPLPEPERD